MENVKEEKVFEAIKDAKVDPIAEAEKVLQEKRQGDLQAFSKEYEALCEKFKCRIAPVGQITEQGVQLGIQAVFTA